MPRLQSPRSGRKLKINDREISFSFWPAKEDGRGTRALQTQIYTNDPWNIIETAINKDCAQVRKEDAKYFYEQAKDYYNSSLNSSILAAKPLQTYYAIMNLVKVFLLVNGPHNELNIAMHGLCEANSGLPFSAHFLTYYQSGLIRGINQINIFDEYYQLISANRLASNTQVYIRNILEQIVLGHRLWCDATNSRERFLRIARISYIKNGNDLWLKMYIFKDDLTRMHITHQQLLQLSGLNGRFVEVDEHECIEGRDTICLEQIAVQNYTRGPSDIINELSRALKNDLWEVLLDVPPYRKYYLFLNHNGIVQMNQLCSIYALSYYLGSITRYRPKQFSEILDSPNGAQIREFVNGQVVQFIYSMASRFAKREINKPGII